MPDLPRRRPTTLPPWMRPITERLSPAVKFLVVAETVMFAFYIMVRELRPLIEAHLALGPGLMRGEAWQPVTALFVHLDPLGFVFDLIGLWFVGAFIERTNGRSRFLEIFFGAGILGYVAMGLVGQLKSYGLGDGCSAAVLALFIAFGRMYDRTPVRLFGMLGMQARNLAILLVVWALIADLARTNWAGIASTLVASAVGYALAGAGLFDFVADFAARFRARRLRRRYRVLDGGQSGASTPNRKKPSLWN